MKYTVEFPGTFHAPGELAEGTELAQVFTVMNSPLLFGCRTGICGTCLVEVVAGSEQLQPAGEEEKEALDMYAPENDSARLACQIHLNSNIALCKLGGK